MSDRIKVHILRYDCFAEIIPMRGGAVVDPNPVVEIFVDGGDVIVDFDKGGGVDWRSIAGVIFFDKGAIFGNIDGDRVKDIAVCVEVADQEALLVNGRVSVGVGDGVARSDWIGCI